MSIDYEAEDAKLDAELSAMYAPEQTNTTAPDNEKSGTATNEETEATTTETVNDNGTPNEAVEDKVIENTPTEPMVPESRYKEAVRAMNQAQRDLADYRKNESQLQSQIQTLQGQLSEKQANDATNQEIDDASFADAKEIYPEVINPLLKLIDGLKKDLAAVSNDVGNVKNVTQHYQQSATEQADQQYWSAIRAAYSDVDQIAESPDYTEWFDSQSPGTQQLLTSQNADDVITGLRLYRAEHPATVSEPAPVAKSDVPKADKLAAAKEAASPTIKSTTKPETKPTFTAAQIEKMSREEFMKHEDAIDEAMARGEIY